MREWSGHSFEKISILDDYLQQFARATKAAPNRVYIDAFAGDTENMLKGMDRTFAGSAEIALSVKPPFTHVRLFERDSARCQLLRELATERQARGVELIEGDCNERMASVLQGLPVQAPTFAFLDPDGMELDWMTIRQIAEHKRAYAKQAGRSKVEMWILFSTGGIVRMLGRNREYAEAHHFPEKVARLYGAWGPWQDVWRAKRQGSISPGDAKKAYLYLYMDRVADLGYKHLLVRPVHTSRNELYAMVFASDHEAGKKIMQWAQEKDRTRPRPGTLFDLPEARPRYEDLYTGWRDEIDIELSPWEELA